MTLARLEHSESVSMNTAVRSLSECGHAVAIAPTFSTLTLDSPHLAASTAVAEDDDAHGEAGRRGEGGLDA